ncbi:MAG TPA: hypothetical protein VMH87_03130 [Pseudomonadales bacterium]|nr:hypothetical protein [Pseudomonadales bacterium]
MSTLSNISPATSANPEQGEQAAVNSPAKPGGIVGLFEEIMAHVQSVPNPPSDKTVAGDPVDSKTSGKANAKQAEANSHLPVQIDGGNTVVNPEITISQMLAAAVAMASPTGKEVAPEVSPAPTPTAGTAKSGVIPSPLFQIKGTSSAAAKISASDLSEDQTVQQASPVVQKANQLTGKEAGLQAKNPDISIPTDSNAGDSTMAKSLSGPDNPASKEPDPDGNTVTPLPPDAHGTSIAKQEVAMKQAEKTNNIAGQTEKVLPGGIISATKANASSYLSSNSEQVTATAAANSSQADSSNAATTASLDAVDGSAMTDTRTRMLERTQEMVTVNAARLSDSGNSSMQVVIKPDAGTQLSLELRQQGGNVHVQAVLQQGDFGHLNQQWSDLQHRLGLKGIQLAPLTDDGSTAYNGGRETFQNKQSRTTEGVPEVRLADRPASMFTVETAPATAHQGWETWA